MSEYRCGVIDLVTKAGGGMSVCRGDSETHCLRSLEFSKAHYEYSTPDRSESLY